MFKKISIPTLVILEMQNTFYILQIRQRTKYFRKCLALNTPLTGFVNLQLAAWNLKSIGHVLYQKDLWCCFVAVEYCTFNVLWLLNIFRCKSYASLNNVHKIGKLGKICSFFSLDFVYFVRYFQNLSRRFSKDIFSYWLYCIFRRLDVQRSHNSNKTYSLRLLSLYHSYHSMVIFSKFINKRPTCHVAQLINSSNQ